MDEFYEKKLKNFISENNIKAEQIVLNQISHTVKDAALALGIREDDIIKSVVFIGEKTIIGIVLGDSRASSKRLMKLLGVKLEVASPEQVLERTGFPVGGVPPFGYEAQFFIDPKVMEKKFVYSGGGSSRAVMKASPKEIIRINKAVITRIRK